MDSREQDSSTSPSASSTPGDGKSSAPASPDSPSTPTYGTWAKAQKAHHPEDSERWEPTETVNTLSPRDGTAATTLVTSDSSAGAFPARTSPSQGSDEASGAGAPASSSSSPASQRLFGLDGSLSRTYPASSLPADVRDADGVASFYAGISVEVALELGRALNSPSTATSRRWTEARAAAAGRPGRSSSGTSGRTSPWCAPPCASSGTESRSGLWTVASSECRSDGGECSSSEPALTEILMPPQSVPHKYSLSARAAGGILRRAQSRGRKLPTHLRTALERVQGLDETDRTPSSAP